MDGVCVPSQGKEPVPSKPQMKTEDASIQVTNARPFDIQQSDDNSPPPKRRKSQISALQTVNFGHEVQIPSQGILGVRATPNDTVPCFGKSSTSIEEEREISAHHNSCCSSNSFGYKDYEQERIQAPFPFRRTLSTRTNNTSYGLPNMKSRLKARRGSNAEETEAQLTDDEEHQSPHSERSTSLVELRSLPSRRSSRKSLDIASNPALSMIARSKVPHPYESLQDSDEDELGNEYLRYEGNNQRRTRRYRKSSSKRENAFGSSSKLAANTVSFSQNEEFRPVDPLIADGEPASKKSDEEKHELNDAMAVDVDEVQELLKERNIVREPFRKRDLSPAAVAKKIAEINARPSRKASFGTLFSTERLKRADLHQSSMEIRPPSETSCTSTANSWGWRNKYSNVAKLYSTEEEAIADGLKPCIPLNTWESFVGIPQEVIECVTSDGLLAYRDGTRDRRGRLPRAKEMWKVARNSNRQLMR